MKTRVLMSGFVALTLGAASLLACGDDDSSDSTPTPTSDSGPAPGIDASQPLVDAGQSDAPSEAAIDAQVLAAPIVPLTTTRMANTINPYGLLFASDGFLYASGATLDATSDRVLAVWRFKDGVLDTTFGNDGVVTVGITGTETSYDLVEVSPGNFVVHAVTSGTAGKVYLVKLTKDVGGVYAFGTPAEVAFDWTDGDLTDWPGVNPPAYATSWGIALDKSNAASSKIVVFASGAPAKGRLGKVGGTQAGVQRTDNDRWVARVLADTLLPDPAFNGGKAFSADIDNLELGDNARRGIVQADGSIVAAGYTPVPGGNNVALIRLLANGTADPAFGFGTTAPGVPGLAKFNPFSGVPGGFAEAYGIVRQSTGRYVTSGYGISNFDVPSVNVDLLSFGVKADGLDPTFGKLGAFVWQSEKDKSAGLGAAPYTDRGRAHRGSPGRPPRLRGRLRRLREHLRGRQERQGRSELGRERPHRVQLPRGVLQGRRLAGRNARRRVGAEPQPERRCRRAPGLRPRHLEGWPVGLPMRPLVIGLGVAALTVLAIVACNATSDPRAGIAGSSGSTGTSGSSGGASGSPGTSSGGIDAAPPTGAIECGPAPGAAGAVHEAGAARRGRGLRGVARVQLPERGDRAADDRSRSRRGADRREAHRGSGCVARRDERVVEDGALPVRPRREHDRSTSTTGVGSARSCTRGPISNRCQVETQVVHEGLPAGLGRRLPE